MLKAGPQEAAGILAHEAFLLDSRRWDEWLALFTDDVEFWVPAWRTENEPTNDPQTQLSLIYLRGIGAVKERVWRVTSGLSRASETLHRTTHVLGSIMVQPGGSETECTLLSGGAVHVYSPTTTVQHCFFGRYQHTLRKVDDSWKIARKHVTLMNDCVPTMLDFYSI